MSTTRMSAPSVLNEAVNAIDAALIRLTGQP